MDGATRSAEERKQWKDVMHAAMSTAQMEETTVNV